MKPLLLLTGGNGTVGRLLLEQLRRSYRIRITTRTVLDPYPAIFETEDEVVVGDLADQNFARSAVEGCHAILHLAANASPAASVGEAFGNVSMMSHLFSAAREFAVRKLVIASSIHATGLDYRDGVHHIDPAHAPRPCCSYGASKIAVEALARLHQNAQGDAVSCLRLGLTGWPLIERQYAHTWLSTGDLLTLIDAALNRSPGFGIYHGVSLDSTERWNTKNALEDLGWEARDRWEVDTTQLPLAASTACQLFSTT
ncbi:NAD(P)-dependent oxidoreductase [Arthrobacter sp. UYCu511]|uniref:NAD-dependent epimerase/dehydratase family protein n=1 Tax=Arthrobacter sp. UYCu511 TaxID=3156337 RepID=UPI003394E66A